MKLKFANGANMRAIHPHPPRTLVRTWSKSVHTGTLRRVSGMMIPTEGSVGLVVVTSTPMLEADLAASLLETWDCDRPVDMCESA